MGLQVAQAQKLGNRKQIMTPKNILGLALVLSGFLTICSTATTTDGRKPLINFDNHPESGIPLDAKAQERGDPKSHGKLSDLVGDSIKTVRVRYFSQASWAGEKEVREYIAGLLTNKLTGCFTFQIWSQVVGEPEIECLVDFTDDYRHKVLYTEHKPYQEGRLLIWGTAACFRDATGRWWFVSLVDYFRSHHPSGNRELSRKNPKPQNAEHWGNILGAFQMATSLDKSNGVIHCWVRNAGSNAVPYNDFTFGYGANISLEIRQGTERARVNAEVFPGGNVARGAIPTNVKVRWLQSGQIITNTWVRHDTSERRKFLNVPSRETLLARISEGDTFALDLVDARWWPTSILQHGSLEARVGQTFHSASPGDPYPYMHGPEITLYSPVFILDAGVIQSFVDRREHEK